MVPLSGDMFGYISITVLNFTVMRDEGDNSTVSGFSATVLPRKKNPSILHKIEQSRAFKEDV